MTKHERSSRPDRLSLGRSADPMLDALLDRAPLPDEDPARWQPVAQVLTALTSAPESSELAGEARALEAFRNRARGVPVLSRARPPQEPGMGGVAARPPASGGGGHRHRRHGRASRGGLRRGPACRGPAAGARHHRRAPRGPRQRPRFPPGRLPGPRFAPDSHGQPGEFLIRLRAGRAGPPGHPPSLIGSSIPALAGRLRAGRQPVWPARPVQPRSVHPGPGDSGPGHPGQGTPGQGTPSGSPTPVPTQQPSPWASSSPSAGAAPSPSAMPSTSQPSSPATPSTGQQSRHHHSRHRPLPRAFPLTTRRLLWPRRVPCGGPGPNPPGDSARRRPRRTAPALRPGRPGSPPGGPVPHRAARFPTGRPGAVSGGNRPRWCSPR